jgi:hypothetical protein
LRQGIALADKLGQIGVIPGYFDQAENLLCFLQVCISQYPSPFDRLTDRLSSPTKTPLVVTTPPTLAAVALESIQTPSLHPYTFSTLPQDVILRPSNRVLTSLCPT